VREGQRDEEENLSLSMIFELFFFAGTQNEVRDLEYLDAV